MKNIKKAVIMILVTLFISAVGIFLHFNKAKDFSQKLFIEDVNDTDNAQNNNPKIVDGKRLVETERESNSYYTNEASKYAQLENQLEVIMKKTEPGKGLE